ncbi:hypothetical protein AJ78_01574 [Emergomyces pasteurianus Ep9510]|uniref:Anaphase-promoting complex subunit 11 n=1 Tax=Emergomyces pasteurianus Ep9510 TaxID=1447872 RepID=A0A1J9PR55_9EURO|nr:hypothetical protein AJ78_01574 [Emergomyces pasteurianus Ep9510]
MASGIGHQPLPRGSSRKRVFEEIQHNNYAAAAAAASTAPRSAKRSQVLAAISSRNTPVIDLTSRASSPTPKASPRKRKKTAASHSVEKEERRRRVFRNHPPQSYLQKLDRARSQRLFVVGRQREGEGTDEVPVEKVQIVGSTGNLYEVVIGLVPWCTCPDSEKGNQCKHIIYVLHNVLKVSGYLQYQLAFLSSELREIFANAPVSPKDSASTENETGKRKPIEGDCPICFMEFEPATEEIVWCKAACGNNMHETCFKQWAATQQSNGVRCVICRSTWEVDGGPLQQLLTKGRINDEGYINVADQFGLPNERDYSTYHPPWSRRRYSRYYYY